MILKGSERNVPWLTIAKNVAHGILVKRLLEMMYFKHMCMSCMYMYS